MSARTPSKIVSSRASSGSRADVRQHPDATAWRRPSLPWTSPYPHAAVPGSMPRTFTYGSYAGVRTFLRSGSDQVASIPGLLLAVLSRPGAQIRARSLDFGRAQRLRGILELLELI